jgi:hypothetical protein
VLVDPLRRGQVLQAVLAEVDEPGVCRERGRRRRDEHLSAVPRGRDARGPVDVGADVPLVREVRRPGVDPDADPHHPRRELGLCVARRVEGAGGGGECVEEGVALRVDLDAPVPAERVAEHGPVLVERGRVPLRPQLVQQAGRPLDVREEERDGSRRELGAHGDGIIAPPRARRPGSVGVPLASGLELERAGSG